MAATSYLHWAATPYTWQRSGLYHSIISGDGHVQRMHAYTVDLPAHTWHRNSNSVALSCACMGAAPIPGASRPPPCSWKPSARRPPPSPAAGAGARQTSRSSG